MTAPNLFIKATSPAGPSVGFGLAGDGQITRSGGSGGGGWQLVDRPRRAATTEWVDYGPFQLTVSLILDGYGTSSVAASIESAIITVESWEIPAPGSSPPLPPILSVTGPVPHNELSWVAQSVTWKEAIRDQASGIRYQQNLDVVLWQYIPPSIVLQAAPTLTPAAAARAMSGSSGTTYTVKSGDTLESIAARIYGDYRYWTLLANANGIRDPKNLTVGTTVTVPAPTSSPPPLNLGTAENQGLSGNNAQNLGRTS